MSQMATPGVFYSQKRECSLQNIERENMWKNLGNILYFWFCMVKSKYLNSENIKKNQHLIEDDEMSQMATPGVFYSQKRDCGLQNIERENMWRNLGNILYIWLCMVKSKYQ